MARDTSGRNVMACRPAAEVLVALTVSQDGATPEHRVAVDAFRTVVILYVTRQVRWWSSMVSPARCIGV